MALSLSCPCGARFEVEETFAGQTVTCPDCQRSLRAPAPERVVRRTSGLALASVALALMGAFTVVGTVAAVLLGLVALIAIARHRDRLAGVGFAVLGIVLGTAFTALTLFAYSTQELFGVTEQVRTRVLDNRIDFGGPLEVVREDRGFALTRATPKWGVAKPDLRQEMAPDSDFLLVNSSRLAFADVTHVDLRGQTLESYRASLVQTYQNQEALPGFHAGPKNAAPSNGFKLRHSKRLPDRDGAEVIEVCLDLRVMGQSLTYLIHLVRRKGTNDGYVVRTWTARRRFSQNEEEMRKVVDSFRLLP